MFMKVLSNLFFDVIQNTILQIFNCNVIARKVYVIL